MRRQSITFSQSQLAKSVARMGTTISAVAVLIVGAVAAQPPAPPQPPVQDQPPPIADPSLAEAGQEILTRGPVHEAFAKPVTLDAAAGIVVDREPPQPVQEIPPDLTINDPNVLWIPGYWAWDETLNDFIWVSGLWRVPPPHHVWIPGYWAQMAHGYQWTSGYWLPDDRTEVTYVPPPPASLETGPNVPSPGGDYFWVPGCWEYQDFQYVWRPGYWSPLARDWVWIPAHYIWTPRGCARVDGFWDYALANRGMAFAPVYWNRAVYARPNFAYTPRVALNWQSLLAHLFIGTAANSYYFGDFYGPQFVSAGYYPWFQFATSQHGYDPLFNYERWRSGQSHDHWVGFHKNQYDLYTRNKDLRPRHTFHEQQAFVDRVRQNPEWARQWPQGNAQFDQLSIGRDLSEWATRDEGQRFAPMNEAQRQAFSSRSSTFRDMAKYRAQTENEFDRGPGVQLPPTSRQPNRSAAQNPRVGVQPPNVMRLPNEFVTQFGRSPQGAPRSSFQGPGPGSSDSRGKAARPTDGGAAAIPPGLSGDVRTAPPRGNITGAPNLDRGGKGRQITVPPLPTAPQPSAGAGQGKGKGGGGPSGSPGGGGGQSKGKGGGKGKGD